MANSITGLCDDVAWQKIVTEYRSARLALEQLAKESGPLGAGAEDLILKLDASFAGLERRVYNSILYNRSLTPALPPAIDRSKVQGILAYRVWKIEVKGALSPAILWRGTDTWRSEVAFADAVPSKENNNGLHATRLEQWEKNNYSDDVSGIVDLFGKVVEHEDSVMRAECARVKMIIMLVTAQNQLINMLTGAYELMKYNYPNTPIYMVTPYQKKLIMWREVLINQGAVTP